MNLRIVILWVLIVLLNLKLSGSLDAQAAPAPTPAKVVAIPFVPLKVLIAVTGSRLKAFDWNWKALPISSLDETLLEAIENDTKTLHLENEEWDKFKLPAEVSSIHVNPATHLEYIVMVPHDAQGSIDANVVYVYDTVHKAILFKTCVFAW